MYETNNSKNVDTQNADTISEIAVEDKNKKKTNRIIIVSLFLILLGIIFAELIFFTVPIVVLILVLPYSKGLVRWFLIILLILFSVISVPILLYHTLPYIYTPPALTPENLAVYNECIEFAKARDEHTNFMLTRRVKVLIGCSFRKDDGLEELVCADEFAGSEQLRKLFSEDEIVGIEKLAKQLHSVDSVAFQIDNDMLLFYKSFNDILPFPSPPPAQKLSILPTSAGVLYSLNGRNPNEVDSEAVNANKPFIKIQGNWYMSRHLILASSREDVHISIPKSLFDYSLRTECLNLGNGSDKKLGAETEG